MNSSKLSVEEVLIKEYKDYWKERDEFNSYLREILLNGIEEEDDDLPLPGMNY